MIEAIVAIGNSGQIGLNGKLPWHCPEDLKWFREKTMGKTCIAGYNTMQTLPELPGRYIIMDCTELTPPQFTHAYGQDIMIIGGAKTYARWAPFVDAWYVSMIDYDGPCDTVFDISLLDGKKVIYR